MDADPVDEEKATADDTTVSKRGQGEGGDVPRKEE